MNLSWPKSIYSERPSQRRALAVQFRDLGIPADASPIEIAFAEALLKLLVDPAEFGPPAYISLFLPNVEAPTIDELPPINPALTEGIIHAVHGCKIGPYVTDFCLAVKAHGKGLPTIGAVECDGHEYHERTKDQAAYDRRRDRYMQELGIMVLRFPGFEIHHDPARCAREALNILVRRSGILGAQV